jgi:hypothetical protein
VTNEYGDRPGRWEGSVAAARAQQLQLAGRVERQDRLPRNVRWLAGLDVGFEDNGAITAPRRYCWTRRRCSPWRRRSRAFPR